LWKECKGPEHDISYTAFAQSAYDEQVNTYHLCPLHLIFCIDMEVTISPHQTLMDFTHSYSDSQLDLVALWILVARSLLANKQLEPQRDITDITAYLTQLLPNTMPLIHIISQKHKYIPLLGYII
jgi:hypothetical protein